MKKITTMGLVKLAKNIKVNGMVAFSSKDNAQRFAIVLRKKGFKVAIMRSGGPTVDGRSKRNTIPYMVIATGRRKR